LANAAKSKPRSTKPYAVHVEVLQNGASLARCQRKLSRVSSLALTSAPEGELALPFYPLPNNKLEFFRRDGTGIYLVVDHKWDGFCTSKGELLDIARGDKGRREVAMHPGDYGSIGYDDLRILVKIAPETKKAKPKPAKRGREYKGYGAPLLGLFAPTKDEKRSWGVGAAIATVIIGGFVLGLMKRQHRRPQELEDIAEPYMVSFVAPDHLRHGPEALQGNLDRKKFARSVLGYYRAVTDLMMGWGGFDARLLPPQTVAVYEGLFADARRRAEDATERQELADASLARQKDAGIIRIPAVVGESIDGGMLRVIDKIGIMQQGFGAVLAARRQFIQEFPKDPDYDFEEYRALGTKDDKAHEYLSKIKPWERSTDEEMMYAEADKFAERAQARRTRLENATKGSTALTTSLPPPIGLPIGTRYASFLDGEDKPFSDEKLYKLEGITYGGPKPSAPVAAKEPAAGEIDPALVERFIKQNRFQLQLCYELALRRDELATGTMEWSWRINDRGQISNVALVSSSINDQKMTQCIKQKISSWRFPRPRRGSIEVRYPFEFAPNKG